MEMQGWVVLGAIAVCCWYIVKGGGSTPPTGGTW
mgnify:CR=1 FL=1